MNIEFKAIKSYITFLSRNKTYTFINVLGFSLSLMFVIIIGLYASQEYGVDRSIDNADRIYTLGITMQKDGQTESAEGTHWRTQRTLKQLPEVQMTCGVFMAKTEMTGPTDDNVNSVVMCADSTFFRMFSIPVVEGDRQHVLDQPGAAVVSEEYARRMFGDVDPVGRTLYFANDKDKKQPLRVTGVFGTMRGTSFQPTDVVVRFELAERVNSSVTDEHMSNASGANVFMLVRPGCDLKQKERLMDKMLKESGFWFYNLPQMDVKTRVERFADRYFCDIETVPGGDIENSRRGDMKIVNILFVVGLVILVFSITNYVNLTVAQASTRAKEMATRRLLGAQRSAIVVRLISESLLMCLLSLAVAVVLAVVAMPYAAQLLDTSLEASSLLSVQAVGVGLLFVVAVGVLSGIIPAVVISRAKPVDVVRGTFRLKSKMWFSKVFIVFQSVITILMIACSLTMLLQVRHLVSAPLGYDHDRLLKLPAAGDSATVAAFVADVSRLSCVERASVCLGTPMDGGNNNTVTYDDGRTLSYQVVYGDRQYMPLLGLRLIRDNHVADEDGVYVNRQTLRELGLPLDARSIPMRDGERLTVRGVLADFHIRDITETQHPMLVYIKEHLPWSWSILVKVRGDEKEAYRQVDQRYKLAFKHDIAYFEPRPFADQTIRYFYDQAIRMSTIVSLFAAIAVVISLLGLVAMSTYFIEQRRKEIAIRKVFGSTSRQVYARLLRTFLSLVGVAFVVAVPLIGWLMGSWLSGYSYRIALSWWIYLAAGLFCLLVSFVAVMAQSYRAANENPAASVKGE